MKQTPITRSAQGENCTVRISGVCNGNHETVVFAHINGVRFGHGMGLKASDLHGCYACSSCHDALDRRNHTNIEKTLLKLWHYEAMIETQLKLIKKGLVKL